MKPENETIKKLFKSVNNVGKWGYELNSHENETENQLINF